MKRRPQGRLFLFRRTATLRKAQAPATVCSVVPPRPARRPWAALLSASVLLLGACGDPSGCEDPDEDGFGPNCPAGPDCDPQNAARSDNCETVPPPDCDADPNATGCACFPGDTECFPGPPEEADVGICRSGRTYCLSGNWGLCEGAVLSRAELCDGQDQDCDGRVDEGVLSPCGACQSDCAGDVWGPPASARPFEANTPLALDAHGRLTLEQRPLEHSTFWVANSAENTVSRIDTRLGAEVGRYFSGGAAPSRIAVDYLGDAWVANRAFGGISSLRRIAGDPSRCVDRNDNGTIETSRSTIPLPDGEDECVLSTFAIGEEDAVARAIAVDGSPGEEFSGGGHLWVGLHNAEAILEIDPESGAVLDRINTPGFQPYMAAFDPWGRLWMISRDGFLLTLDRRSQPREPRIVPIRDTCYLLYGLAIDAHGRLLLTGFACDRIHSYDPGTGAPLEGRWQSLMVPPNVRGAIFDDEGAGWIAHTDGHLSRLTFDPLTVDTTIDLQQLSPEPFEAIGVGLDDHGGVWVASSQALSDHEQGVATRVQTSDATVTTQIPIGQSPHSQGDMTGAKRLGTFAPSGVAQNIFGGCGNDETEWEAIYLRGDWGAGGHVDVAVRWGASEEALRESDEAFVPVASVPNAVSPLSLEPLALPEGGALEVQVTLRTEAHDGAPRLQSVGVRWDCGGPI